jgi:hypothetical protein
MPIRSKGSGTKRDGTRHLALPHVVIKSPAYRSINHTARSLLIDIALQYDGYNNGKLVACEKYLRPMGWTSNDTITRALRQLVETELLIETRKGRRPNKAAWFALGWCQLDIGDGLDINPSKFRTGGYQTASLAPSDGVVKTSIAPSRGLKVRSPTPPHGTMQ